jgi:hypothetical protein
LALLLFLGNLTLLYWNWVVYIREVGVSYERRKAVIALIAVSWLNACACLSLLRFPGLSAALGLN